MSLPVFLLFGFVVGLLARAVMPGNQKMGLIATTCLGIAGSFMGGLLGSVAFGNGRWNELRTTGLVGSIVGALFLMVAARFLSRR
jgi:uncharacterized membrane protein YeaQ/YmgE (transglycosylase-associated protein family)